MSHKELLGKKITIIIHRAELIFCQTVVKFSHTASVDLESFISEEMHEKYQILLLNLAFKQPWSIELGVSIKKHNIYNISVFFRCSKRNTRVWWNRSGDLH